MLTCKSNNRSYKVIIAGIATMPDRIDYLEKVVSSIRPQVDLLRVYLNNFDEVPAFLSADEGCLSKKSIGDLGAEGKFYWFDDHESHGFDYYLTVDDDIGYPEDYVATLLKESDKRNHDAIVGVHGSEFKLPILDFVTSRKEKYRFYEGLKSAQKVHMLGTATTLIARETIDFSLNDFQLRNASDLQLAIVAQKQHIPMVVIPREAGWMTELRAWKADGFSIWKSTKLEGNSEAKTRLAQSAVSHWELLDDPLNKAI